MAQKMKLIPTFLLLSIHIVSICCDNRITTVWKIQRTYQRDIIQVIPGNLRCSDIEGARTNGWNGVCSCPMNQIFHVNFDGTKAKCFGENSLCNQDKQDGGDCHFGYGWKEHKPSSNGETRLVLRYVVKSQQRISCSNEVGGRMSEWYGNNWKVIDETNHLKQSNNERFIEVVLTKDKIESGLLRLELWCNDTPKTKQMLYIRLLQNATYLYPPSLTPKIYRNTRKKENHGLTTPTTKTVPRPTNASLLKEDSAAAASKKSSIKTTDTFPVDMETLETLINNQTALEMQLENEIQNEDLLLVIIIGVVAGAAIFSLIVIIAIIVIRRSRSKNNESISPSSSTHTSTSTFYDTDIVYANPASMNLSRKADNHEPRDVQFKESFQETYASLEGGGFYPQGYQTLTDHRNSINSTREIIPKEDGFHPQGYQTLTDHRNSINSTREIIPKEDGFHPHEAYQTLSDHRYSVNSTQEIIPEEEGETIPEEHGFNLQGYQTASDHRNSVDSTRAMISSEEGDEEHKDNDAVYFETEEVYHDPNDFDYKTASNNKDKAPTHSEPFYFQTDIIVASQQNQRQKLKQLPLRTSVSADHTEEEIYVNNDPFESPVEEDGPYAYSTVNKAWITPENDEDNDFETDFSSFTIV